MVLSAVIPVFVVAGAGYVIRRHAELDVRTLATLNIYLFIPALIFANLSRSAIEWRVFGQCALGVLITTLLTWALLATVGRFRCLDSESHAALLMTMFPNFGNFGLPIVTFAFGEEWLALALVVLVCGSFAQNSLGVYFAQRSRHGAFSAFVRVLQFPMIYAFFLALLFNRMQWNVPEAVFRAVSITASAAIPVQLVILGAKLAETRLENTVDVFLAAGIRLLVGPLIAVVAVLLTHAGGTAGKVFIVMMSGPTAVAMSVYGVQFGIKPRYLASAVSWSFLLSVFTVSAVLYVLLRVDF